MEFVTKAGWVLSTTQEVGCFSLSRTLPSTYALSSRIIDLTASGPRSWGDQENTMYAKHNM